MNEIDWPEYSRRKARISNIGLTAQEYEAAVARIVKDLEWEADLPRRYCPSCGCVRLMFVGAYICAGCQGHFEHSDLASERIEFAA